MSKTPRSAMTHIRLLRSALPLVITCMAASTSAQSFKQRAQAVLDSIYLTDTTMVGLLVHLEAPDRSISWTGVSGRSEKGGAALQPKAPFLIASNIKTYVSATILALGGGAPPEPERSRRSTDHRKVTRLVHQRWL
ncbi:MAG: hypothetical protein IPL64_11960 [Flavobacteriales bacterium]|nr:hypothetical protein [Flavobacteriales bacterium]